MYRKYLTYIALFLIATGLHAAEPAEDLEILLRELRETRTTQQRESTAAQEEFRRLEQLIAQRQARLDQQKKANAELARQVAGLEKKAAAEQAKQAKLTREANERRETLARHMNTMAERVSQAPFLEDELESSDKAHFWSQLISIADKATQVEITERQITVNGTAIQADIIQLGNAASLWLTRDHQRGGIGYVDGKQVVWQEQPEKIRKQIAHAMQIVRNEVPAEAVVLPVHVKEAK